MSLLAHATFGARGFQAERRALDARIQAEIVEAKRLQRELGCTWSEALRLAKK
ncbi:MAG: hypothetical protein JSS14_22280 [Proteobacteria bacterium]|nr:hypothetical protein [Pseudomonadota bacterium]